MNVVRVVQSEFFIPYTPEIRKTSIEAGIFDVLARGLFKKYDLGSIYAFAVEKSSKFSLQRTGVVQNPWPFRNSSSLKL